MSVDLEQATHTRGRRVRLLGPADRACILAHFLALDASDIGMRFGAAADEAALARYVQSFDFARDAVLGMQGADGALDGVAHLAVHDGVAELGLSVVRAQRQRGVAAALATAALRAAQRAGAHEFRFHCAATNDGMLRIARRLGMAIEADGSDVVARRALKPRRVDRAGEAVLLAE